MSNYCYLAAVKTPEKIRVVRLANSHGVGAGDLIRLSDRQLGTVISVIFVEAEGDDYNFIGNLAVIEEEWVDIYTHRKSKEEARESA